MRSVVRLPVKSNSLFEGMQMLKIKSLVALTAVVLCSAATGLAQQSISPEKKALIKELREMVEPQPITLTANLSTTPVSQETYTAKIESDPELTDAQKKELKNFIAESAKQINEQIHDFFADKELMKQLSEEVGLQVYDKNFTDAELRELIAFYRSPTGQKVVSFMITAKSQMVEAFEKAVSQKLQEIFKPKMQDVMEEMQKRIREAKAKKKAD